MRGGGGGFKVQNRRWHASFGERCDANRRTEDVCDKNFRRVPVGTGTASVDVKSKMKIIKVEAFAVQAKPIDREYWGSRTWGHGGAKRQVEISAEYPPPERRRFIYSKTIDTCLVRVTTESGLVGYGEAKAPIAPRVVKTIIDELLAPLVIGADAR